MRLTVLVWLFVCVWLCASGDAPVSWPGLPRRGQLMTFHVLPVTSSEDVDPLDLNDLISNLGE